MTGGAVASDFTLCSAGMPETSVGRLSVCWNSPPICCIAGDVWGRKPGDVSKSLDWGMNPVADCCSEPGNCNTAGGICGIFFCSPAGRERPCSVLSISSITRLIFCCSFAGISFELETCFSNVAGSIFPDWNEATIVRTSLTC